MRLDGSHAETYSVNMRQDCSFKSLAGISLTHRSGHTVSFRVQQLEAGVLIQLDSGNVRDDGDLCSAWRYFFQAAEQFGHDLIFKPLIPIGCRGHNIYQLKIQSAVADHPSHTDQPVIAVPD